MVTNRIERLAPGSELATDRGPLRVEASRPHKGRHLVTFEGISTRDQADELRGVVLRAVAADDPDELWVHELIGASVVDQHGVDRGPVVAVVENPASDLLELADGSLVPVRFAVGLAGDGRVIDVDVPDGLFGDEAAN